MSRKENRPVRRFFPRSATIFALGLAVLLLLPPPPLAAQSKYAGESFSIGVGGRGLGMGSAYHTLARGPEALYWNPAGLAESAVPGRENSLALMHSERFDGEVSYNFLGWSRRLEGEGRQPAALGLGLIHLGVGGIPVTTRLGEDGRPVIDRYISRNDFAFLAGYGRKFGEALSLGGNVKVLHMRYEGASATGFGLDAGAVFRPPMQSGLPLAFSLSARDLTTSFLAYSTGKREYIKPWISGGVALERLSLPGGSLAAALELSIPVEHRRKNYRSDEAYLLSLVHLGLEYSLQGRVALRAGLDERNPCFGAGIAIRALAVDYAWVGHRDLHQTHRVSLGYSF